MAKNNRDEKLRESILYAAAHSPYYSGIFKTQNIDPKKIETPVDLHLLPFTNKAELQARLSDFICVPKNKLIDHVSTSGTTGKPVTISLTDKDLDRLALNEYNSFKTAGIKETDIIQLMTTLDRRFMAGLAYFLGARKLGAGIIRVGNGIPELQWDTIMEMKPTVIICVPSFLLKLIEYAETNGIDYKNSSVKKVICIGEAIRHQDFRLNTLGALITNKWNLKLFSTYASSEMATAFTECEFGRGAHIQEDLIIAEIVDDRGKPVIEGEPGELVVTPLGIEGMPLIRFRTGDICVAHPGRCRCGSAALRLGPIIGRKSQMIKYKGTTLFPNAIYEVLDHVEEVKNYQVELSTGPLGTDEILINIGATGSQNIIHNKITDTFKAKLRVVPKLNFLSPEEVNKLLTPASSRKPLVFFDKRTT